MLAQLLALIAPPCCAACAAPVPAGRRLCRECTAGLPWIADPCGRCGLPAPCRPCPAARAPFARAWAPVALDGPARALVHALKFHGRTAVAATMAAQIAANAPRGLLPQPATLVPVPTHPRRARQRGFDQALLLARALAPRVGLPVVTALARRGGPTRQLGASRAQRAAGPDVAVRRPVPGAVVLVDDVHTTGASLAACALALRAAGARTVIGVTYARTLG